MIALSCNKHIWYDGLDQLVFKMKWRLRSTNIKNFVVVSCRPFKEIITKLLDKNLSQLRYPWGKETLTLIQAGTVLAPFSLLFNVEQFLAIFICYFALSMAFFTFLLCKSELLLIGTCFVINKIILFNLKKICT